MKKRRIGNSELITAPIALGGNVFGWTADEATSFSVLDAFFGFGFNLIDTADIYSRWVSGNSGGESEIMIGNWMKQRGNRNDLIIATKVGGDMGNGNRGLKKDYILKAADESLKRLQTDHIDLYQTHFDDLTFPVDEPLEAYARLIEQGKVRYIGASNFSPARLSEALTAASGDGLPAYQSFQPHYNLVQRSLFEGELEAVCKQFNLGVITYSSLASGFLTGKYRKTADINKSVRGGSVEKYMNAKGVGILSTLDNISETHNVTPAAIALAWLIDRPSVTAPIASATSVTQLVALSKASEITLNEAELEMLGNASAEPVKRPHE